jgi:PadR family transcriptional regulator, regulatory protein AphA
MANENTTNAILGILSLGPHSGYDIKKLMEQSTGYFWSENYGQIYPALNQLLKTDDVTLQVIEQEGKPDRKVYSINEKGRQTLIDWLSGPIGQYPIEQKNELLLKLFFGLNVPEEVNIQHVEKFLEKLRVLLSVYLDVQKNILDCEPQDENSKYWLITLNYGSLQVLANIQWCEETLIQLK